jgi:hypothetical protein
MKKKIIYFIRWLLVLPCGVLSTYICTFIYAGILTFFKRYEDYFSPIGIAIVNGITFVFFGTCMAPDHKEIAQLSLGIFSVVFYVIWLYLCYDQSSSFYILYNAVITLSALLFAVFNKRLNIE